MQEACKFKMACQQGIQQHAPRRVQGPLLQGPQQHGEAQTPPGPRPGQCRAIRDGPRSSVSRS